MEKRISGKVELPRYYAGEGLRTAQIIWFYPSSSISIIGINMYAYAYRKR